MFSFIKYMQLVMIGYDNAFVNAYYLLEVYGEEILGLNDKSWSVEEVNKN